MARAGGILVGYIPGPAMHRIADLHAGEAKTDARYAAIVPETDRSLPHRRRPIAIADQQAAELSMLCGFDDDLEKQATATSNRIRRLLTQIHRALERAIGTHLDHPAKPEWLIKYPSQEKLLKAGQDRVATLLATYSPGWETPVCRRLRGLG